MKTMLLTLVLVLVAATAFGAAGDTIRSFSLGDVRGLAYDYSDATCWAVRTASNNCQFNKFNITTGSTTGTWTTLSGHYWVFDMGYGYTVSGTRYFVALDQNAPRLRMYTTTGSYYGTMTDPFSGGYDEGIDCDWGGTYVYAGNYSFTTIYRWGGSSWATFGTVPSAPPMGVAACYGNVWVVITQPGYCIYRFNTAGSLLATVTLNSWGGSYMVGLSQGRVDAQALEDTLFVACFSPQTIKEVSVGDVISTGIAPKSLGQIKALYN